MTFHKPRQIGAAVSLLTLFVGITLASGIRPVAARPQFDPGTHGCSLASVVGTYGVSGGGTVGVGTATPVQDTEVGLLTADGRGDVSGSVTFSANGTLLTATYTGTYVVNSDCTASASINDSLGEHLHETGVVLRGGSEIRFIGSDPGAQVSRDAVRLEN